MSKRCLADNTIVQACAALFLSFSLFRIAPCHANPACWGHTVLQRGIFCRHGLDRSYALITCTTKGTQHNYTLLQTPSTKVCRNMWFKCVSCKKCKLHACTAILGESGAETWSASSVCVLPIVPWARNPSRSDCTARTNRIHNVVEVHFDQMCSDVCASIFISFTHCSLTIIRSLARVDSADRFVHPQCGRTTSFCTVSKSVQHYFKLAHILCFRLSSFTPQVCLRLE